MIISPNGHLELLPLSFETVKRVDALAKRQQQIIRSGRSLDGHLWEDEPRTENESFLEVLYETWSLIGEPIVKNFEESGILGSGICSTSRVWWCLTGQLAFLPIHACLPRPTKADTRPIKMMDIAVSSYTPTLSTLLRTVRQKTARPFRMLAIGQPESKDHSPLSYVTEEIDSSEILFLMILLFSKIRMLASMLSTRLWQLAHGHISPVTVFRVTTIRWRARFCCTTINLSPSLESRRILSKGSNSPSFPPVNRPQAQS